MSWRVNNIDDVIEQLGKSPLFNLSLASKELFHSNFLAWAIEQKGAFAARFLKKMAPELCPLLDETLGVEREANNFDLTIIVTGESGKRCRIVVENKVKSIASAEQLREYDKKLDMNPKGIDETIKALLSLTDHGCKKMAESLEWRFCGYEVVLDCIDDALNESSYEAQLMGDYKRFIQALVDLRGVVDEIFSNSEEALLNPFKWPEDKESSLYGKLKSIRMHDIFEKWRMLHLKEKLESSTELSGLKFGIGFTRGLGLLDIEPANRPSGNAYFKIQVQGLQLRQVLEKETAKGKELFIEAKRLLDNNEWFLLKNNKPLHDCGSKENEHFCKYGNIFVYRHEPLENLARLQKLTCTLKEKANSKGAGVGQGIGTQK